MTTASAGRLQFHKFRGSYYAETRRPGGTLDRTYWVRRSAGGWELTVNNSTDFTDWERPQERRTKVDAVGLAGAWHAHRSRQLAAVDPAEPAAEPDEVPAAGDRVTWLGEEFTVTGFDAATGVVTGRTDPLPGDVDGVTASVAVFDLSEGASCG